jgi:hypothetical protein
MVLLIEIPDGQEKRILDQIAGDGFMQQPGKLISMIPGEVTANHIPHLLRNLADLIESGASRQYELIFRERTTGDNPQKG